jgi:thioredoxin-dependent peroxiredoxin
MPPIQVGDVAPSFTLPDKDGNLVSLSDYAGIKPLVIFFYPYDYSKNCTREVCAFRDNYDRFQRAGAEVIGISSDPPESHRRFSAQFYLPYILLSDEGDKVKREWGVPDAFFGLIEGRVTYVLDHKSVVRNIYISQLNMKGHVNEALATLDKIAKEMAKE